MVPALQICALRMESADTPYHQLYISFYVKKNIELVFFITMAIIFVYACTYLFICIPFVWG